MTVTQPTYLSSCRFVRSVGPYNSGDSKRPLKIPEHHPGASNSLTSLCYPFFDLS